MNRREALFRGFAGVGAAASVMGIGRVAGAVCAVATPAQTEGPFYPVKDQFDKDSDLTILRNKFQKAQGQVVYIRGSVVDEGCAPVAGALVEIWQACASGRYNHPGDTNPAPLDPFFQYWGRALSGAKGEFVFKTILPGAYPADVGWVRPPHIHYKVSKHGYEGLTTQMYFDGEELNGKDLILNKLSKAEQDRVIVKLEAPDSTVESSAKVCEFEVILKKP